MKFKEFQEATQVAVQRSSRGSVSVQIVRRTWAGMGRRLTNFTGTPRAKRTGALLPRRFDIDSDSLSYLHSNFTRKEHTLRFAVLLTVNSEFLRFY